MLVLGINAYHPDAAAAILLDGKLVAAAEEERFNRIKHSAGFPSQAVKYCLKHAGASLKEVDHVGIAQSPNSRWLSNTIVIQSDQFLVNADRRERFLLPAQIKNTLQELKLAAVESDVTRIQVHLIQHHLAHLASAFLTSKFVEAALASIDSFGDFSSTMTGYGKGSQIHTIKTVPFPHSLGVLYTMITQYLGFLNYGDEGKVMGLAAYGKPRFLKKFNRLISYESENGFRLNLDYFTHHEEGFRMIWPSPHPYLQRLYSYKMVEEFGPARLPGEEISDFHCDIAASLYTCLEESAFCLLQDLYLHSGSRVCIVAGGVAFNSVLNTKLSERTPFQEIYIPPAAGDSGTAVGAAFYVYNVILERPRSFELEHSFWGPDYSDQECREALEASGLAYQEIDSVAKVAAQLIAEGKIIGWFQGRMEFGPRALGNRSILADPRSEEVKYKINSKIKFREHFRPFAASILAERVGEIYQNPEPSPYMSRVFLIRQDKRNLYPATTHVDGTTRLQTASYDNNPLFWSLIKEYEKLTQVPMVLNTSFNQQDPIVCRPDEAIRCYLNSGLDALFLGRYLAQKGT